MGSWKMFKTPHGLIKNPRTMHDWLMNAGDVTAATKQSFFYLTTNHQCKYAIEVLASRQASGCRFQISNMRMTGWVVALLAHTIQPTSGFVMFLASLIGADLIGRDGALCSSAAVFAFVMSLFLSYSTFATTWHEGAVFLLGVTILCRNSLKHTDKLFFTFFFGKKREGRMIEKLFA